MKEITVKDIAKSLEYERNWWGNELLYVKGKDSQADTKRIWMRKIIEIYDANLDDIHRLEAGIKNMMDIAHDNVKYYSKYPEYKAYEKGYSIREKICREILGKEK